MELYELKMVDGADLTQHINTFNMLRIDIKLDDEDKAMLLLTSLLASYEHLVTALCWGRRLGNLKRS